MDKLIKELQNVEKFILDSNDFINNTLEKRLELQYNQLSDVEKVEIDEKLGVDFNLLHAHYLRHLYQVKNISKNIISRREDILKQEEIKKIKAEEEVKKNAYFKAEEVVYHALVDYILNGSGEFVSNDSIVKYTRKCLESKNYIYCLAFNVLFENIKDKSLIGAFRRQSYSKKQIAEFKELHIKKNAFNHGINLDLFNYKVADKQLKKAIKNNIGGYYES